MSRGPVNRDGNSFLGTVDSSVSFEAQMFCAPLASGENLIVGGRAGTHTIDPFDGVQPRWNVILSGETHTINAGRRQVIAGGLNNRLHRGDNGIILGGSNHQIGRDANPPFNPNCDNNAIVSGNLCEMINLALRNTMASCQSTTFRQTSGSVALATIDSDILGPLGGPNVDCNLLFGRECHSTATGVAIIKDTDPTPVFVSTPNSATLSFTGGINLNTTAQTTIQGATFRGADITTTTTLVAANSGTYYTFDGSTDYTITLPALTAGFFVVLTRRSTGAPAGVVISDPSTELFGTVNNNGTISGLNSASAIRFESTGAVGDNVSLYCDGTRWHVQATSSSGTGFTITA